MRCEICTPAGRKEHLEILYKYIKAQKEDFDIWQVWVNTTNLADIEYMKTLALENSWIKLVPCPVLPNNINTIGLFFPNNATQDNTIYIRFDDDIVYMELDLIKKLKAARLKYSEPFLVYPNIINNAIISNLHYRNLLFSYKKTPGYLCMDDVGWKDPEFTETIHRALLQSIQDGDTDRWKKTFNLWKCSDFERVSINCISWFGEAMRPFNFSFEEEQVLSVEIPKHINRPNLIIGDTICVHYAFGPQRDHLSKTDILQQYRDLATKITGIP
jgi:hypothetical protein